MINPDFDKDTILVVSWCKFEGMSHSSKHWNLDVDVKCRSPAGGLLQVSFFFLKLIISGFYVLNFGAQS